MKKGVELIADERQEQIEKHGWDSNHDAQHNRGELTSVACGLAYNVPHMIPDDWQPFKDKMLSKDYKQRLIIAGALIAAELDRLQRLEATHE